MGGGTRRSSRRHICRRTRQNHLCRRRRPIFARCSARSLVRRGQSRPTRKNRRPAQLERPRPPFVNAASSASTTNCSTPPPATSSTAFAPSLGHCIRSVYPATRNPPNGPVFNLACTPARRGPCGSLRLVHSHNLEEPRLTKQVVAALIVRGDEILCCQRTEHQALPLKWEFPGGKIEAGETPPEALRRELEEELGIRAEIGPKSLACCTPTLTATRSTCTSMPSSDSRTNCKTGFFATCVGSSATELPALDFLDADKELVSRLATGELK